MSTTSSTNNAATSSINSKPINNKSHTRKKSSAVPVPTHYCYMDSPLGKILIAEAEDAIVGLWFSGQKYEVVPDANWDEQPGKPLLRAAVVQLGEYFNGERTEFDLKVQLSGTEFQRSVWQELMNIPCGETISYGALADRLGKPSAVRAAAAAVGKNPASVVVPCHRVIGANGSLTGYAGGLERKQHLLGLESRSY